ncbi:MAG: PilZ domain-containing protein [Deltaproteobacteria bacterium]|nr:PilZ domain-containing protein [Deltaproteobacteria bacterium]MBN2672496.1 PilZ domain-containing protein [Deltaproteobacteria bacterium]
MTNEKTQAFGHSPDERRREKRHNIKLSVNYTHGDTYLYSKSSNLSEMGIFLVSDTPLSAGTIIQLRFDTPHGSNPIDVSGEVVWIDPGSSTSPGGMGIRFIDPEPETKARIRTIIRTIAYID